MAGRGQLRRWASIGTALTAATWLTVVGGCTRTISGLPTTADSYSTTEVGGLPATNGPSGRLPEARPSNLPVRGGDGGDMDALAADSVADVQAYWAEAFPKAFHGKEFQPLDELVSYDSRDSGGKVCGEDTAGFVNAFYCPSEDSVAWDRGAMLPELTNSFGDVAVLTVLAHELGHAVQRRADLAPDNAPVIVLEQQADCLAGSFFRHVAEGKAEHFQVSTGDGLNEVMGVLNYIRDAPGRSGFTGSDAHGSAFDRVTAFQYGFTEGPGRCAAMDSADVRKRTTQFQFWKDSQETDLPIDEAGLQAAESSLREVFRDTGAAPPRIAREPVACGDTPPTAPATYCPATNTISLDLPALQHIATPPDGEHESGYGDFAAYAQIASRYALAVQHAAGLPLDDEAAGLRTACLTGGWSGLLVEDPIGQRNPVGTLRIAPGDIDEGVAALLGADSLIAANLQGEQVPAGFARIEAFRIGFQQGFAPCTAKYG